MADHLQPEQDAPISHACTNKMNEKIRRGEAHGQRPARSAAGASMDNEHDGRDKMSRMFCHIRPGTVRHGEVPP